MKLKRAFDLFFSFMGLIFFSPLLLIISALILKTDGNPIMYRGLRIGANKREFPCFKFRTMKNLSDKSAITVGDSDSRITSIGKYLRRYKLDELPQLYNVLLGNMSLVGPRPDVRKYSKYYEKEMEDYYFYKPGITSPSSIFFADEAELYVNVDDPEKLYIEDTIPKKVALDKEYLENISILMDIKILIITILKIIGIKV